MQPFGHNRHEQKIGSVVSLLEREPRPWPYCARWGLSSPYPKGSQPPPQFSIHFCCGQTAGWIKIPLGAKVGLERPGPYCVRWGPSSPPQKKRGAQPTIFDPCPLWPNGRQSQLLLSTCMNDALWNVDACVNVITSELASCARAAAFSFRLEMWPE